MENNTTVSDNSITLTNIKNHLDAFQGSVVYQDSSRGAYVTRLKIFQQQIITLCQEYWPWECAGIRRLNELYQQLKVINESSGHCADAQFAVIHDEWRQLSGLIASEIAGYRGERNTECMLRKLQPDSIVLKNIELEDDGHNRTEIDFVVITSRAIFNIEIKNNHGDVVLDENGIYRDLGGHIAYNLADRISMREYCLHRAIMSTPNYRFTHPINIVSIVATANNNALFTNHYHNVIGCSWQDIPDIIEFYQGSILYTEYVRNGIRNRIGEAIPEPMTYQVDFDFEKFKTDFADLLLALHQPEEKPVAEESDPQLFFISRIRIHLAEMLHNCESRLLNEQPHAFPDHSIASSQS
ncbi:MAG: nuclease-related domain-containing protein [Bulleidia sp.]|nr:nuclease-related domain-containing protein [Bulleidia sp.]